MIASEPGTAGKALDGQTALIAGASRGIGLATALKLEALGARIASIQRGHGPGLSVEADLGDGEAAQAAVSEIIARLGHLDICIYAAGRNHRQPCMDIALEDWQRVIDLNLTGAFVVTRAAARQFVAQGEGGRIVHVASELSFFGGLGVAPYAASKGGVVQLAKSQAVEWAELGIRVNAVAPGWIETEMTEPLRADADRHRDITQRIPAGSWGAPEDIASAIAWIVSPEARYVHGAVIVVDGGYQVR